MSETICKFMPERNNIGKIKVVNFVYETDIYKLSQPFIRPIYYVHLVTNGTAVLKMVDKEYKLKVGDIFFGFPGCPYQILNYDNFKYLYITFMGGNVNELLDSFDISYNNPVYSNFEHLFEFWMSSISRISTDNANLIAESVLLYTLSFFNIKEDEKEDKISEENVFDIIVDYIDNNYKDYDISLKKVASMFSYTDKYFSYLFKKKMNIGFNSYITNLRLKYAYELLETKKYNVSEIASMCGFGDSLYFSKVFKKHSGYTPNEYLKKHNR